MVEHAHRSQVGAAATFHSAEPLVSGRVVSLAESEALHARVRRIVVGERVRLVDGAGSLGWGTVVRLARAQMGVEVEVVEDVQPLPALNLILPIADRDRMLWLAEKATELGVTSWRPVLWRRSRSVAPRGEGVGFQAKVRARMVAALTQSCGAWLPALYPDAMLSAAIAATPPGTRLFLDRLGSSFPWSSLETPVTIAVGPEGGVEAEERDELMAAGFQSISVGPQVLRFETAALAALAIARAALTF